MPSQRFFIGNLPAGTSENDVKKPFKDFGDVVSVELKEKASLVDPSDVKVLAFVTLNLYDGDVDFCLRKLNSKQINGEYIRVSVAKESFLERLKREREESTKKTPKTTTVNSSYEANVPYNESYNDAPKKSKKSIDTKYTAEAEDTNANPFDREPLLNTKKRASTFMARAPPEAEVVNNKFEMQSQRFFIGNLPAGTSENDVKKPFKDFGDVVSVELKEKASLVDPSDVKVLAFVTLNLYDGDVDFCLRKLNSKQINGEYIRVSVAKESFLERLKREREESTKKSSKTTTTSSNYEVNVPYNNESYNEAPNKSKKFFDTGDVAEAEDTNDNLFDDGEPVLITKKRAANSMRNGRIVIEGALNATPITVIGKKRDVKELSEKSFDADKKRKESVNKKKNQYQLQKSLIQKSLTSVDSSNNKQIFFDNDDEEDTNEPSNAKQLFQDDSDQEEDSFANNFAMKAEHEGSHGAALMKLQSKMSLDPRFKIDSKFVDKIDGDEQIKDENSERDWQYGILEQVVGSKFPNTFPSKDHGKNKLNMLRYDPSKENQDHFLIKRKPAEPMDEEDENIVPQKIEKKVSKEVFYMVSDNLSNSLKTRGDGFSLLSMFGRGSDENELNEERTSKEKILISKTDKTGELNPFSYDSSSESENEQESKPQDVTGESQTANKKETKENTKPKLFVESFFIPKNDVRLKEGKSFFRSNKQSEKIENYDEVKDKLKNIINKKITKSKKQFKGIGKQRSIRSR